MANTRDSSWKSEQKVAVLVLGMHRSGTSMLGGVLECLGCQGPKTMLDVNPANPKGYFESKSVMTLDDDIFTALGSKWSDWMPLNPGWQSSPRFNEFRDRIARVMEDEYGAASLIYLKDPRICRLLPLWREVLEEIGYRVVCIHTHRNPLDVARSLEPHVGIEVDTGMGMLLWLRHVLDAERASRGLARIFTSYGRMLEDWAQMSERAEETFGFGWPLSMAVREQAVRSFMDGSLRHHDTGIAALLKNGAVSPLIRDALAVFESWADAGEDAAGREVLDAIRAELELSSGLFVQPLAALGREQGQRKALSAETETLTATLAAERQAAEKARLASEAEIGTLNARLGEERSRADALLRERDALSALDHERQGQLRQGEEMLNQTRAEAEAGKAERDALSDRLAESERTIAALRAEIDAATDRLIERDKAIAALRNDAAFQRDALEKESRAITDKLIERDKKAIADRKAHEAKIARLEDEIRTLRGKAVQEKAVLDKKLASLTADNKKRIDTLTADNKKRLDTLSSANRKALEAVHRSYRASTSWKISAPIRAIGRLLKRGK